MSEVTAADQCPTCGRVSENWAENRDAIKGAQRSNADIDRCAAYKAWRWKWGAGLYVNDLDQVEWRMIDGHIIPVVVLELTRLDGDRHPLPMGYLQAIVERFTKRDAQGSTVVALAHRLGVDAVLTLFRHDLSEFWLFNLSAPTQWFHLDRDRYRAWLADHRGRA